MWHMRIPIREMTKRGLRVRRGGGLKMKKTLRSGFGAIYGVRRGQGGVCIARVYRSLTWTLRAGATLLYVGSGVHRRGYARRSTPRVRGTESGCRLVALPGCVCSAPSLVADPGRLHRRADRETTEREEEKNHNNNIKTT